MNKEEKLTETTDDLTPGMLVEKTSGEHVEKTSGDLVEKTSGELVEKTSGELIEKTSGELVEPYMYILLCGNGSYYVGSTKYLKKRIVQHQNGEGAKYTKLYQPITLVYFEKYDRIQDAFKREKQIQKWSRAKKEALINGDIKELKRLSKSKV